MTHPKIIGIGWNYRSHLAETDASLPEEPIVFLKPSSSLIGDGDDIIIPKNVGRVDYEGELALVFGRRGRNIGEKDALSHVSHLAAFNDVTARDMQTAARDIGNPWDLSKGMDTFGPMSEPVPVDGIDVHGLNVKTVLNGSTVQDSDTSYMIFTIERLISYVSRFMTIDQGDIMITGTPEGIGPLEIGDKVTVTVSGVGSVTNRAV